MAKRLTHATGDMANASVHEGRILYGRRKGRRLREGEKRLMASVYPAIRVILPDGGAALDPSSLFPSLPSAIWLEIGFGVGEHLLAQARVNPDKGFIGCEPYQTGVVRLVAGIDEAGLTNIRILQDDARALLASLPDSSIERIFVLFPDPWPKLRHHKRRFLSLPVIRELARVLQDGGELRVATDHVGYLGWILEHVRASGLFEWTARGPADWRTRPDDWPGTRYEAKAAEAGRPRAYLRYVRRIRPRESDAVQPA